jgi:hypothetical protein
MSKIIVRLTGLEARALLAAADELTGPIAFARDVTGRAETQALVRARDKLASALPRGRRENDQRQDQRPAV